MIPTNHTQVGQASPNPSYPQDIKNTGDNGSVNEKVQNKNLLNITSNTKTNKGVVLTIEGTHLTIKGTASQNYPVDRNTMPLLLLNEIPVGTYTFSTEGEYQGRTSQAMNFEFYDKDNNKIAEFETSESNNSRTFIVEAPIKTIKFFRNMLEGQTIDFDLYLQLEQGSTATEYQAHAEQNISFPLAQGQKLMEGDYLADDGVHHVRGEVVLDGTESWGYTGQYNNMYSYNFVLSPAVINTGSKHNLGLSNYFHNITSEYQADDGGCYFTAGRFVIFVADISTVNDLKTWLADKYSNNNPVIVEYNLAEEVIDPYTEEQAEVWEQIKALRTYKPVTHITSEDETPATVDIVYVRDLETVIDNIGG